MAERRSRSGRTALLALGALAWAVGAVLAFLRLDPIVATFAAVLGLTVLLIAYFARDWDQHSTYEEREAARARRRQEKWERGATARARDRARWEAHQARKAGQPAQPGDGSGPAAT